MKPVAFKEQSITESGDPLVIGKPEGWTDEQCGGLPAWIGKVPIDNDGNFGRAIISCHEATEEEKAEFARTGKIWLIVHAQAMPPVSIRTTTPFEPNEAAE